MNETTPKKPSFARLLGRFLLRCLSVLLITVLSLSIFLLGIVFVLSRGPSETARDQFVRSVKETSAIGFLADLFLPPEEVASIISAPEEVDTEQTDTSLVEIGVPAQSEEGPYTDAWGYVDDDGDGLILVPIKGGSYVGYMLIVLDPSRVILGCPPSLDLWRGHSLDYYIDYYDGVAGINGGGFDDPHGQGDGSLPDTLLLRGGEVFFAHKGVGHGFVGIDSNYVLHVGLRSLAEVQAAEIQEGCGFGPVLVVNGEMAPEESLRSGLNPRTAIGQRTDGAILMLVIEGRQPSRLGATYTDLAEEMLRFGAANACNLDGGSSSLMWVDGEYVNNSASVIGIRTIPSCFIVLKEGRAAHEGQ